jgi:hypothetical protein
MGYPYFTGEEQQEAIQESLRKRHVIPVRDKTEIDECYLVKNIGGIEIPEADLEVLKRLYELAGWKVIGFKNRPLPPNWPPPAE